MWEPPSLDRANFPGAHNTHALSWAAPSLPLYLPVVQFVHVLGDEAFTAELYFPLPHSTQRVLSALEYLPATQSVQDIALACA